MNLKNLDWGSWLYAILKAVITGAASAIVSYLAMPALNSAGVQMPTLTLRQMVVLMCISGATHLAAVLMKSPMPPADGSPVDTKTP